MVNIGYAGEFRIVIKSVGGEVREDFGFQRNMILNQCLDFLGGNGGNYINAGCVVGSGTSTVVANQTSLDIPVAHSVSESQVTQDYSYTDTGDGLYHMWEQKRYRFSGLKNVNITEVGLTAYGDLSTYLLTTRALIKDSLGNPTSITIKDGEVLDVYYKIHKAVAIDDKVFTVNMLDGRGGSTPYNVTVRPVFVGKSVWSYISNRISTPSYGWVTRDVLSDKVNNPQNETMTDCASQPYVGGTYKRTINFSVGLSAGNFTIKTLHTSDIFYFYPFQAQFASVAGGLGIPKTSNDTLSIPIEFSWGRYEGAL